MHARTLSVMMSALLVAVAVSCSGGGGGGSDGRTWQTLASFQTNVPGVGAFGGRCLAGGGVVQGKLYLLGGHTLPFPNMVAPPCPTATAAVDAIAAFTP